MKISLLRVLLCSMTLCLCAANALADDWADDSIITTVLDPQGQTVFSLCASVNEGDEYKIELYEGALGAPYYISGE